LPTAKAIRLERAPLRPPPCRWTDDPVHENVVADGPVAASKATAARLGESLDAYLAKQNRYTTLQAEAMHARASGGVIRLLLSRWRASSGSTW